MNINHLKPAWLQFRMSNSMAPLDREEILLILETAEGLAISKTNRLLVNTVILIVFTFCCQGG
jgi:hypothetical protein